MDAVEKIRMNDEKLEQLRIQVTGHETYHHRKLQKRRAYLQTKYFLLNCLVSNSKIIS